MDVCTIIAKNYLPAARVLAESFREHHPDGRCFVLVIDDPEGYVDPGEQPFELVTIAQLDIEHFARMSALYSVLELSTAVKPWLLRHLLDDRGVERITYLDPDIEVFDSLEEVDDLLREHRLVINPHLTKPMPRDGRKPSETDILIAGAYNLGFVGLAAGPDTEELLDWWSERLETDCIVAPERGLFVDQRWMDFAPGLVKSFHVLRDPGYNVAYWNLPTRDVRRDGDGYTVDGSPLRFFHYSGYDPRRPELLSKHQDRISLAHEPVVAELCERYGKALLDRGYERASQWPYDYDRLPNGLALDKVMRRVYRDAVGAGELTRDIFSERGARDLLDHLRALAPHGGHGGINRYLYELWRSRSDLRGAFPDLDGEDAGRFVAWSQVYGRVEVPIPAEVLPGYVGADGDGRAAALGGVNVAGYFRSVLGVGEHARQLVKALETQKIPVAPVNLVAQASRQADIGPGERAPEYGINLVCVNADVLPAFAAQAGDDFFAGRYSIGYWAWEVASFPERFMGAFQHVDEVWAGSTHTAEALMRVSPVPVVRIPQPLSIPDPRPRSRADLGLPEGFLFLFSFDYNSVFERKNPLAVVEAFARAFPAGSGASLLVKCINADRDAVNHGRLTEAASGHPDVHVMDEQLAAEDRDALVAASDCYVSLHRAEGFGYTLAEAMWLGKPVVATGYSGNLDYMTAANSYLVDYRLEPIGKGADPYPEDGEWAQPDVDHAAALLREVFEQPDEARRRGERGQREIRRSHSPEAAGSVMAERLRRIASQPAALRASGALPSAIETARVARRIKTGPPSPRQSRFGRAQQFARRSVLRVIKPYTAHQRYIDEELLTAIHNLDGKIGALTMATSARLDDLSGQVDVLRADQQAASRFLASFGLGDGAPVSEALALDDYPDAPAQPWTHEWVDAHRGFVARALDDPMLLARFKRRQPLAPGYGVGFDERVVEFPWTFTRDLTGRLLDAGSTLNHPHVLMRFRPRVDELHIVTLAPEAQAYPFLDVSYLFEDLRSLPIDEGAYDRIVSLSTLEHIGMETAHFGFEAQRASDPDAELGRALRELRRVLNDSGVLYVTVPFGAREDFGWMRQFDAEALQRLIDAFSPSSAQTTIYRYDEGGWQLASAEEAADARYRDHLADPRPAADRAVAARAVACLELAK